MDDIIRNTHDSWDRLPLSKFIEIGEIDPETNPVETQAIILSILTDTDEDLILNLPITQYTKLSKSIQYLYQRPTPKPFCPSRIDINGRRYRVCRDVREWSAAQFIDYQNYLQKGNDLNNLPYILSTAIVPYNKDYNDGYDLTQALDDIRSLSVKTIIDMSAFFLGRWTDLSRATAISLALRTMRMRRRTIRRRGQTNSRQSTSEDGLGQGR